MKHQTVDATCTITLNTPTRLDLELNKFEMTPEPGTDECLNSKLTLKQDGVLLGENVDIGPVQNLKVAALKWH